MAYTLISSQTLASATATVTFSSIPQIYKDLVLEFVGSYSNTTAGSQEFVFTINGDTGTNYSVTYIYGNGTSPFSNRRTSVNQAYVTLGRSQNNQTGNALLNFMSYANTSIFKTILSRSGDAAGGTALDINLWRSNSAITSIQIPATSTYTWNAGSTFKLWGVS